ncbi:testis-expressed protein 2 [Trichonephila inaurata madagascariensis]|uniref:Testis-expressed protein 2 n=1 Tax=Trichonephila inaurata madagascariensis TaxID=2747483 RepID=A0A8X7BMQ1_9ARAC|nr:testis-expressed protein 2 [Trichonephila inaurata madagascariensis]
MAASFHSNQQSEEICLNHRKQNEYENVKSSFDLVDNATIPNITVFEENEHLKTLVKDDSAENLNIVNGSNSGGTNIYTKNVNVRENPETSPFKQAVKGFVLNKLSKKVGSSHLLSGLTEKIVKKLEEGRENTSTVVQNVSVEKSRVKESNVDLSNDSIPCELRSVVANDISEISNVEEAVECFEESKTSFNSFEDKKKIFLKPKVTSRSLPSSPARHFARRTSADIDHSSDSEDKSSISESTNIAGFSNKLFQNLDLETSFNYENSIELNNMSVKSSEVKRVNPTTTNTVEYFENVYAREKGKAENLFSTHKYQLVFLFLKNLLVRLPLPHVFLLISIIIHNSESFSLYYINYIFDGLIVAYVIYTLVCILIQIPSQHVPPNVTYNDTQLEMSSIHQNEFDKLMKGSVKILKGEYDSEEQSLSSTELVNVCIENNCLKILHLQKEDDSEENVGAPYEVYDLCGANISLVPKGLSKRRIFRKKFPICIMLPAISKKLHTVEDTFEDMDQEEKCDYFSLFPYQDGLLEMPKRRALYIFALTDREKETWYWALKKCVKIEEHVTEFSSLYSGSPKFDATSLSYSSLMEMSHNETLSIADDSAGKSAEISFSSNKTKPNLEFGEYVKILFENYQREINAAKFSWTSEDIQIVNKKKNCKQKDVPVEWMNVALGRLFYDFLTQKHWSDKIMAKIQKKLNQLDMPTFMETLEVTDVFMGTCIPQLHSVSNVVNDEFGIWFDFDFTYNGSFQMTLQTKLKMPKTNSQGEEPSDSTESKPNVEGHESSDEDGSGVKKTKHSKFINKIEKWITHKHFQTVAQSKFVKKYVGDISNMLLTLTVEVNLLQGILAVNLPPVPTDRVWYGFRKDPILSITVSPKVGSHEINLSAIVKMIEQRLIRAFKKAIVMPHMDDFIIPLMFSPAYEE